MASSTPHILCTGGAGFIGSHTTLVLLEEGYQVTIVDSLVNAYARSLDHVKRLVGPDKAQRLAFVEADVRDAEAMAKLFAANTFDVVVHFAGLKAVGESVQKPLEYYSANLVGSVVLLEAMARAGCKNLVFSSSATVYGMPTEVPITEGHRLEALNPYGRTKLFQEHMFRDVAAADPEWRVALLRYFNPVGAHPSGQLGEHPVGVPNNLMPYVQQVATGQRPFLRVYGADYPTPDGSGVRDYVHIMDLAAGHVAAVQKLLDTAGFGCRTYNLGTGKGTSVVEMVAAFEAAAGVQVPYQVVERRAGDAAAVWADTSLAEKELGWKAAFTIEDMCRDQWRWAQAYPQGFDTPPAATGSSAQAN